MMMDKEIEPAECAIFADVQDEPRSVYEHLDRLVTIGRSLGGPEIHIVTKGCISANLREGVNSTGQRFVSIPAFLKQGDKKPALGRRQCTQEYKIRPIEKKIREIMNAVGRPLHKGDTVTQVFGLSYDEPKRVDRVKAQFLARDRWEAEFPLFEFEMTRTDCLNYLKKRWHWEVPRSACVFCPYRSDDEWQRMKDTDPEAWARAVQTDKDIRDNTSVCTKGMIAEQFLHRSCVPLEFVELKPNVSSKPVWNDMDCEGMCGV